MVSKDELITSIQNLGLGEVNLFTICLADLPLFRQVRTSPHYHEVLTALRIPVPTGRSKNIYHRLSVEEMVAVAQANGLSSYNGLAAIEVVMVQSLMKRGLLPEFTRLIGGKPRRRVRKAASAAEVVASIQEGRLSRNIIVMSKILIDRPEWAADINRALDEKYPLRLVMPRGRRRGSSARFPTLRHLFNYFLAGNREISVPVRAACREHPFDPSLILDFIRSLVVSPSRLLGGSAFYALPLVFFTWLVSELGLDTSDAGAFERQYPELSQLLRERNGGEDWWHFFPLASWNIERRSQGPLMTKDAIVLHVQRLSLAPLSLDALAQRDPDFFKIFRHSPDFFAVLLDMGITIPRPLFRQMTAEDRSRFIGIINEDTGIRSIGDLNENQRKFYNWLKNNKGAGRGEHRRFKVYGTTSIRPRVTTLWEACAQIRQLKGRSVGRGASGIDRFCQREVRGTPYGKLLLMRFLRRFAATPERLKGDMILEAAPADFLVWVLTGLGISDLDEMTVELKYPELTYLLKKAHRGEPWALLFPRENPPAAEVVALAASDSAASSAG